MIRHDAKSPSDKASPAGAIRFRTVGFDLDGTLVDSAPAIAHALNHTLRLAGLAALDFDQVRAMIGGGIRVLLDRALKLGRADIAGADFESLHDAMVAAYAADIARDTRIYDGLVPALDALAAQGIALGVATNKLESLAVRLLKELGLADRFACVIGGDTLGPGRGKPRPDMIHALIARCGGGPAAFVGDSAYDVQAAKAAGVPVVAVSFGYPGKDAGKLGADALIDSFDALIKVLEQL